MHVSADELSDDEAGHAKRLSVMAGAIHRAELDNDLDLLGQGWMVLGLREDEWLSPVEPGGRFDEIAARVKAVTSIPSLEQARNIIKKEGAAQERLGRQRHIEAVERKQRELDKNAAEWPGSHWDRQATEHRSYLEGFHRKRGDRVSRPVARTQARARGAGRPRARRASRSTTGPGSSDPGGSDDLGEAGEHHHLAVALRLPPETALIRDKRTHEIFLARHVRETTREVTFDGQLVHEDSRGVRLYPSRPRRLTRARAEFIARNEGGSP